MLRDELRSRFKNITFNDQGKSLTGQELIDFLKNHDRAIVALEKIDVDILNDLPELKVIAKYGVGLDNLNLTALDQNGVQLGWTAGVNAQAVAECTLGLALNIVRNLHISNQIVKLGDWKQIKGRQLSSLTYGILGCGHVGKALIKLIKPFGAQILSHDLLDFPDFYSEYGVQKVNLEELLRKSDILSIHIPFNASTINFVNQNALSMMKPGSFLINTARGGLVDEDALLSFLNSGHIQAAALDVFAQEPPTNRALVEHPQVFVTSHLGGSSEEAILAMGRAAIQGLNQFKKAASYAK